MRKKLFIGLFLAAVAGIVAGEYLFNRSGAQDAPKKVEPDKKKTEGNLFDILKKDLDAKKDTPKVDNLPPLQFPAPVPAPTVDAKDQIPPPSPPKPDVVVPTPPKVNDPKSTIPPLPGPGSTPQVAPPLIINQAPMPPAVPDKPQTVEPKQGEPLPPLVQPAQAPKPKQWTGGDELPPLSKPKTASPLPFPPLPNPISPQVNEPEESRLPPTGPKEPAGRPLSPLQPIVDQVAKLKDCPWSLQVDMVDGRTVVTATVNKRHEFKIACECLDLQTGQGTLKASGKVQISSVALNGRCEHLAIPLMEDRMLLEGGTAVCIQKVSTNVSDVKPAAFELKGEKLDLRISELQSGKLLQTGWRKTEDTNVQQAITISASIDSVWAPFGTLRRAKGEDSTIWFLENGSGKPVRHSVVRHERGAFSYFPTTEESAQPILHLAARKGGTLAQYEGRTISVYGTIEQKNGRSVMRVTHIAVP